MTERQALRAAKARGLIDGGQAKAAAPTRCRRTCAACGGSYLYSPYEGRRNRGFCCGCCAFAWGQAVESGLATRMMQRGDRVVCYQDGKVGTIRGAAEGRAVVEMEDGRKLDIVPRDVEKVQGLEVAHARGCPKGKGYAGPRREAEGDDNGEVPEHMLGVQETDQPG